MFKLIFLIFLFFNVSAFAEFKFGFSAYYGRSTIYDNQEAMRLDEYLITKYGNNFQLGAFVNYRFNKWFGLQTDILYDQLNTFSGYYIDDLVLPTGTGVPDGWIAGVSWWQDELWYQTEWLSFPLQLQFMTDRINFKIGGQYSYLISHGQSYHNWSYNNWSGGFEGHAYQSFAKSSNFFGIDRHNFSFTTAFGVRLFDNLHLEFKYTNGFKNLRPDYFQYFSKTRQFLLGITYQIFPTRKKELQKIRKSRSDYEGI